MSLKHIVGTTCERLFGLSAGSKEGLNCLFSTFYTTERAYKRRCCSVSCMLILSLIRCHARNLFFRVDMEDNMIHLQLKQKKGWVVSSFRNFTAVLVGFPASFILTKIDGLRLLSKISSPCAGH